MAAVVTPTSVSVITGIGIENSHIFPNADNRQNTRDDENRDIGSAHGQNPDRSFIGTEGVAA